MSFVTVSIANFKQRLINKVVSEPTHGSARDATIKPYLK